MNERITAMVEQLEDMDDQLACIVNRSSYGTTKYREALSASREVVQAIKALKELAKYNIPLQVRQH